MEVEIDEAKKCVIVWLCRNENKVLAQPIIEKYRGTKYLVAVFRSGSGELYEGVLDLLLHNRKACAEAYRNRFG